MSKPLNCAICGDMVGTYQSLGKRRYYGPCPGKGLHLPSIKTERKRMFGLFVERTNVYPESHTRSVWCEWRGKSKILMHVALWLSPEHALYHKEKGKWMFL
jgi:hypothetical protein